MPPESDTVKIWTLVIGLISGIATPLVVAICAYLLHLRTQAGQVKAATIATVRSDASDQKVLEVKQHLVLTDAVRDTKLEALADTVHDTRTMVNGKLGVALEATAVALRTLADHRKGPGDEEAAEDAEREYTDHMAKQAKVDAAKETRPTTTVVVVAAPLEQAVPIAPPVTS